MTPRELLRASLSPAAWNQRAMARVVLAPTYSLRELAAELRRIAPRPTPREALALGTLWLRIYSLASTMLGSRDRRLMPAIDSTREAQAFFASLDHLEALAPDELWFMFDGLARRLDDFRVRYLGAQLARNASFWAIKTGGVIENEARITDGEVEAINLAVRAAWGADRWDADFRRAWDAFKAAEGRMPVMFDAADVVRVRSLWPAPLSEADWEGRLYGGVLGAQWSRFYKSWKATKAKIADRWLSWRGDYDATIDYRRQALAWRERLKAAGVNVDSPAAPMPTDDGRVLPSLGVPELGTVLAVAGVGLGAIYLIGRQS